MAAASPPHYVIEKQEILAQNDELRVVVLTLAAGEEVPWHWHSDVVDLVLCIEGPMVIETRAPAERFELEKGQSCHIPARRAHRVTGKPGRRCKFAIMQGVGRFDFNPVGG